MLFLYLEDRLLMFTHISTCGLPGSEILTVLAQLSTFGQ